MSNWYIDRWKVRQERQRQLYKIAAMYQETGRLKLAAIYQEDARAEYVWAEQYQLCLFMVEEGIDTFWRPLR